jgi:sulfite exporter TauE/SafE
VHAHEHGEREHVHIHTHSSERTDLSHHRFSPRSIAIGMVHGLAGSAALMLLVVPTIASPVLALLYILIFGIGSICGMMAMSFLVGLPLHFTANRFNLLNRGIRLVAGVFSFGLGAFIVYEKLLAG